MNLPDNYWEAKIMDFVDRGIMKEVPFNSSDFVQRFAKDLGVPEEPIFYAGMSGSMVTLPKQGDGELYMHISRVLHLYCDDAYLEDGTYNGNCFQRPIRSFVFANVLDLNFNPIEYTYRGRTFPQVLDIYEPESFLFAGPEDGRAILDPWGNVLVSFNMAEVAGDRKRRIWRYNITSGSLRQHMFEQTGAFQKNWIPFFLGNQMRYIYGWNPLKVVDCTIVYQSCEFVEPNLKTNPKFGGEVGQFRGGSALFRYQDYYVGTVRTHRTCEGTKRVYRPNIAILSPKLEVIYVSERLEFPELFLAPFWPHFPTWESIPADGHHARILTTLTLTPMHNQVDWIVGFSVNDQKNILVELKGFGHFLNAIIDRHRKSTLPIPDLVQHKLEEAMNLCETFEFNTNNSE
jgi:hypothetical protein